MNGLPYAKKSLGQHWLTDPAALQAICEAADLAADDRVLEIGPGLGTLTDFLVHSAAEVIAVEYDAALAEQLPKRVDATNLQVVRQDILSFDFTDLAAPYKVVANIPYYLTSNLIRVISETPNPPTLAVLLIQKEVAQRVAAKPGSMSLLSVTAQYYWQVKAGQVVPAHLFTPPPKVDSQILVLRRRPKPLFKSIVTKDYFRVVKAGFGQRRKTLLNSLSGGLGLSREQTQVLLKQAGIDPRQRAQSLTLDDWYRLYKAYA